MNLIEETILKDIKKCEEIIKKDYATREDLDGFIAKYRNLNPKFGSNIIYYAEVPGHKSNYASKMQIIKSELEGLLLMNNSKNNDSNQVNPTIVNNIYNTQTQNNNNSNNIYLELDRLADQIKIEVESIEDDELKQEILDNVEGLQDEIKKDKPKKGVITSMSNSLKAIVSKIPKTLEIATTIMNFIKFIYDYFK